MNNEKKVILTTNSIIKQFKLGEKRFNQDVIDKLQLEYNKYIWKQKALERGSAMLYMINLYNDNESFIKIGITINDVQSRYRNITNYKIKTLYTLTSKDINQILICEQSLKDIIQAKNMSYTSSDKFHTTETADIKYKQNILELIRHYSQQYFYYPDIFDLEKYNKEQFDEEQQYIINQAHINQISNYFRNYLNNNINNLSYELLANKSFYKRITRDMQLQLLSSDNKPFTSKEINIVIDHIIDSVHAHDLNFMYNMKAAPQSSIRELIDNTFKQNEEQLHILSDKFKQLEMSANVNVFVNIAKQLCIMKNNSKIRKLTNHFANVITADELIQINNTLQYFIDLSAQTFTQETIVNKLQSIPSRFKRIKFFSGMFHLNLSEDAAGVKQIKIIGLKAINTRLKELYNVNVIDKKVNDLIYAVKNVI